MVTFIENKKQINSSCWLTRPSWEIRLVFTTSQLFVMDSDESLWTLKSNVNNIWNCARIKHQRSLHDDVIARPILFGLWHAEIYQNMTINIAYKNAFTTF